MRVLIPRPLPCEGNYHAEKPVIDRALKGLGRRISAGQAPERRCPSMAPSAGGGPSFRAILAPCFTAEVSGGDHQELCERRWVGEDRSHLEGIEELAVTRQSRA